MDSATRDRYGRMSVNDWYDRILLYDNGDHNDAALNLAMKLAANNGAVLTVAEVIPRGARGLLDRMRAVSETGHGEAGLARRKQRLDRWLARKMPSQTTVVPAVLEGNPSTEVVRAALHDQADLVVIAKETHASPHSVFDATVTRIIRHCPCPVWVFKPSASEYPRRVAAAVGCGGTERKLGATDREIVAAAVNVVRPAGCRLDIIRPWDFRGPDLETGRSELPPAMYRELFGRHQHARACGVARMLRRLGVGGPGIVVHLPHEPPESAIVRLTELNAIDLLVIGLDSDAEPLVESIVQRVHCSVMILKPPGLAYRVNAGEDARKAVGLPHFYGGEM